MAHIITYTGRKIDPVNPNREDIDIRDIAHALSLICRGNGHSKYFFSVAQHSINCALEAVERGYSERIVLGCLLHDGAEAYISDVTRPIKMLLDKYREIEEVLLNTVWESLIGNEFSYEEREKIFYIDNLMLSYEFHCYMPEDFGEEYRKIIAPVECREEKPSDVERRFLGLYEKYLGRIEL